jgi:folate-binding protein YgfZ
MGTMTDDLHRRLQACGAVFGAVQGLTLPLHFGDAAREWRAAREGGAVFAAFRTLLAATGEDRVTFLQGMLSNDVKSLAPGSGVYAAMLTLQGKVVSDLRVYADPDRILLDVVAWRAALLRENLERYIIADDVELAEPDHEQPLLGVEGPLAGAIAAEALGRPALPAEPFAHLRSTFEGRPVRAVVASETARGGVLFCGPPSVAPALFDACREAGAQPLGMRALDTLRIEAGIAWPGVDMDESVLLQESGRDAAIHFSKGCYLGQEVVERIAARGHVNRRLTGLRCAGERIPAAGARVLADGREVGYVTSGTRAATEGTPIALAMINRKSGEPGTQVAIGEGEVSIAATVARLPFDPAEFE